MYEITVSAEFELWFEALDEPAAERVVAALEIIRATGPGLDPARQSHLMLWFDGLSNELTGVGGPQWPRWAEQLHGLEGYRELLFWHREALRCLESQPFRDALAQLDARVAADVL